MKAIGITNQRETTVAFDKTTGKPLNNALVWCDQRTTGVVKEIITKVGGVDVFRPVCGLPINTYFSAVKMRWLLENVDAVNAEAIKEDSKLCFGTIDTWLIAVST